LAGRDPAGLPILLDAERLLEKVAPAKRKELADKFVEVLGRVYAAAKPAVCAKTYKDLTVGYAQLGSESEWRNANTASIKETAQQLGVNLKFSDAQQKQENQIAAIRSFIQQKVDVIGLPPVTQIGVIVRAMEKSVEYYSRTSE
jgi:simple sugar transport system substrate-binding protein